MVKECESAHFKWSHHRTRASGRGTGALMISFEKLIPIYKGSHKSAVCNTPLLILNLSGRRFKTSNAARSAYTCHTIAYIAPFPVCPSCSNVRFMDVTRNFFFFFLNRGATHSKIPHVLSGFPISPDSGRSEAATTKAEVGNKCAENQRNWGAITSKYFTSKQF